MTFEAVSAVIRNRRTALFVDDRPVPSQLVEQLCELAQWAPNHKRTWPWQFALVEGSARGRLGIVISDVMAANGDPVEKVIKTRGKYLRTPVTLVVGSAPGDSVLRVIENRDSVAAGIQNLLLGATALGLASFWSSCAKGADAVVASFCNFEPGTQIVGLIYLGWPTSTVAPPDRPPLDLHLIQS